MSSSFHLYPFRVRDGMTRYFGPCSWSASWQWNHSKCWSLTTPIIFVFILKTASSYSTPAIFCHLLGRWSRCTQLAFELRCKVQEQSFSLCAFLLSLPGRGSICDCNRYFFTEARVRASLLRISLWCVREPFALLFDQSLDCDGRRLQALVPGTMKST